MTKYNILSPDGITIRLEPFKTKKAAITYFEKWTERFEKQGYYSANMGKIPLNQLINHCELIKIKL